MKKKKNISASLRSRLEFLTNYKKQTESKITAKLFACFLRIEKIRPRPKSGVQSKTGVKTNALQCYELQILYFSIYN